ncbi:MAG TPA: hypothetical protein VF216_04080 [Mizugakiibacter sp.]
MSRDDLADRRRAAALHAFVTLAHALLAADDERERCALEDRLLALLPAVRASGLFEIVAVRDPALRAMLDDHRHAVSAAAAHAPRRAPRG